MRLRPGVRRASERSFKLLLSPGRISLRWFVMAAFKTVSLCKLYGGEQC